MQTLLRRKPLHFAVSSIIAIAAVVAFAARQQIVADAPESVEEQLAQSIDISVPQQLRVAGKHTYSVKVTLTGKTEEPVGGPVYLVVEETGIDTLFAAEPDGVTREEKPYFLVLSPNKKLSAELPPKSHTISFKSEDGALRAEQRRDFELKYRLTREIQPRETQTARRDDKRPRDSRTPGIPAGNGQSPRKQSADGNQQNGDDDEPVAAGNDGNGNKKREPFELKENITDKEIKRVMEIQDKWTKDLIQQDGIVGTATGVNADGDLVVRVYTARDGIKKNLPATIQGIPVEPKVVGRFRSMFQAPQDKRGRAGDPGSTEPDPFFGLFPMQDPPDVDDPQVRFPRPIPIGVSGIAQATVGCSTGTIGCRLKGADGTLYALSNNHVFADENNAPIGDAILQPGPFDNGCTVVPGDSIGTLAAFVPINFGFGFFGGGGRNRVDVGVATVTAATLRNSTPRGAYGTPSTETVPAQLGMKVQKMGRTTSHTTGRITGINVFSFVGYSAGLAFFDGQIEITKPVIAIDGRNGDILYITFDSFGGPGDSGSLIVTTYGNNPVGLLFAGNAFTILANPIDLVLGAISNELGQTVTVDGNAPRRPR